MVKIDAHQHFWVFDPVRDSWITEDMAKIRRDFLPGDLATVLKENKVDGCVAVQADQSLAETDFLLELAERNTFIKAVVGWVDLKSADLESILNRYKDKTALKGFRHILQGEPDIAAFLADGRFETGVRKILEAGYSYDLLVYHHQMSDILPLVERLCVTSSADNPCRLVLDHIGKPDLATGDIKNWSRAVSRLAAHPEVYCKVSGLVTEADWQHWKKEDLHPALDVVLEAFGPRRLLFGSDWPVCLVASSYARWMEVLMEYFEPLTSLERAAIFGGNAARFYRIEI